MASLSDRVKQFEESVLVESKKQDKWKVHDWKDDSEFFIDAKDGDKYSSDRYTIYKKHDGKLGEAQHYNTKVRTLDEKMGSRKIRLGMQETKKMIEGMLNVGNAYPSPKTDKDKKILEDCKVLAEQMIPRLKEVKERKGKRKNEDLDEGNGVGFSDPQRKFCLRFFKEFAQVTRYFSGKLIDMNIHNGSDSVLYTFKCDTKFSLKHRDLTDAIASSLIGLQSNVNGEITAYFEAETKYYEHEWEK